MKVLKIKTFTKDITAVHDLYSIVYDKDSSKFDPRSVRSRIRSSDGHDFVISDCILTMVGYITYVGVGLSSLYVWLNNGGGNKNT